MRTVRGIPRRTQLERDLPVELMHGWALREGNRKKPIYELHKWWARRLGTTFRTLLLAATSSSDPKEGWEEAFLESPDLSALTVLDPFMGGGTSLVEAAKLGANVVGVDIDPVACFVTSRELEHVDPEQLVEAMRLIESQVRDRILARYRTTTADGRGATAVYSFWVDRVRCPDCDEETRAHPHYQLQRDADAGTQTVFCSHCGELRDDVALHQGRFRCRGCLEWTRIADGPVQRGRFHCPSCSSTHKFPDLSCPDALPTHDLFALDVLTDDGERLFQSATQKDQDLYSKTCAAWEAEPPAARFAPTEEIPNQARYDNRPLIYGYRRYQELFNSRQLHSLCDIAEAIAGLPEDQPRTFLALALSDALAANNMFCSFAFDYRKLTPLFGLHAYRRIMRPVENNVWGLAVGRGSFRRAVEKLIRGKRYALDAYELSYSSGGKPTRHSTGAKIAVSFEQHPEEEFSSGRVLNHSSTSFEEVPSDSIDLVLTDPPYYNNLPYSELSDFYHVWLRRLVPEEYPSSAAHTPWRSSLFVGRKGRSVSEEHGAFIGDLSQAFSECARVLKAEGLLTFTYHHADPLAWHALGSALLRSPFAVTKVHPVRSEGQSAFHSYDGSLKWDAVFVCRERPRSSQDPTQRMIEERAGRTLATWRDRLGDLLAECDWESLRSALLVRYLSTYAWSSRVEDLVAELFGSPEAKRA